jgi:hypothetical protein
MTDVIEGEIVERQMATVPQPTGVHALAELTDAEFERNLAAIIKGQERIKRMQTALLVKGVDYANIPKVDKPSLGKPGAEKFTLAYNTTAEITRALVLGDGVTTPLITYDARCDMHLGSFDGPVIGTGHGTCNSWEVKYRYRDEKLKCPSCEMPLRHSKAPRTGWYCWREKGGCGWETKIDNDPAVSSQNVGQIENPDPWDLANTLMKMAEKRAHVDATLRTFAASGIFTQDMEENVGTDPVAPEPEPQTAAKPATAPRPAPVAPPARAAAPVANEPPEISDAELDSLAGVVASQTAVLRPTVQSQAAERVVEHRAARVAEQADPHAMTFGESHPCKLHAIPLVQDARGGWACEQCKAPR